MSVAAEQPPCGTQSEAVKPAVAAEPTAKTASVAHPHAYSRACPEELDWSALGFNIRITNCHVRFVWRDGAWDEGEWVDEPYIKMHINSGALHYGVSCFEGMKAFSTEDGNIKLLNPRLNAQRMQRGARRLRMPAVPEDLFVKACSDLVERNKEFVPPFGSSGSMYIRPLLFCSGPMLGLAPLASDYTFLVTCMPVGGYFSSSPGTVEEGIHAVVLEDFDRCAPRGTGDVKAAGNYASDLAPVHEAKAKGFGTTLYLDAEERRFVEEFSVANFIGITKDGRYVTPTSPSILQSTTNMMLMQLARDRGMTVEQRPIDFEAEINNFQEIGMCGTAAVVVRVASITRGENVYRIPGFDVLGELRARFTGIQAGTEADAHGWMVPVCAAPVPTRQGHDPKVGA